jgi:hypothetical protein
VSRGGEDQQMRYRGLLHLCLALALAPAVHADGRYEETAEITGGSLQKLVNMGSMLSSTARELKKPSTTTVMVSGNRMVRVAAEHSTVFDLDKQSVTRIDTAQRQYSVITFAELLKKLLAAQEKLKTTLAQHPGAKDHSPVDLSKVPVKFDTKAETTGATRTISGIATHEVLLTSHMSYGNSADGGAVRYFWKNDQWLSDSAPPGWDEIAAFKKRMAEKMRLDELGAGFQMLLGARPGLSAGLTKVEGDQTTPRGAPVMTVVRLGSPAAAQPAVASADGPAPAPSSAAADAAASKATTDALQKQAAQLDQSGKLGDLLGSAVDALQKHAPGLAQSATKALSSSGGKPGDDNILMEQTIVLANFSAEQVPAAAFAVPEGYGKVDWRVSSAGAVALQ